MDLTKVCPFLGGAVRQGSSAHFQYSLSLSSSVFLICLSFSVSLRSLGRVLGWTVKVIGISSTSRGAVRSRESESAAKTYVSFIAVDHGEVIPAEVVKK